MERQTLWNHNYQGDRRTLFWFGLYHISGTVFFCDFMARSWFQMTFYLGTARNYAWGSQMNYICKRSWSILVAMEQYCLLWINVLICSANGFELQYKCLMKQIKSRESHAIQSQKNCTTRMVVRVAEEKTLAQRPRRVAARKIKRNA